MRLTVTCDTKREKENAEKLQRAGNQRIARRRWFRVFTSDDALGRK